MSASSSQVIEPETEVLYVAENIEEESTIDPPMEEWSSLLLEIIPENPKRVAAAEGLYDPGSGEICMKYVRMSDSSIFRHPYYAYPCIEDPGIMDALLKPFPEVIYGDDGQDLYLDLCKEMGQHIVRSFHRGLLTDTIDLRYYCVCPAAVRAMAKALMLNTTVKVFNLTDSYLNNDACFHLGELLAQNTCLEELCLSGCRIRAEGLARIGVGLNANTTLKILRLDRNTLKDEGGAVLSQIITTGIDVETLTLKYNDLGTNTALALTEAFLYGSKLVTIDLSWNSLYNGNGLYKMLTQMAMSQYLHDVDLSWNSITGPRCAQAIFNLMLTPNIRSIILNNNKLGTDAVKDIAAGITKAKKLQTLDLSYNPFLPADALLLVSKVAMRAARCKNLLLDNVSVTTDFLLVLEKMTTMKAKKNVVVTHGNVIRDTVELHLDPREIVLNRVQYLGFKSKKNQFDIVLFAMQLVKDGVVTMLGKEFADLVQRTGCLLDYDLIYEVVQLFPGPRAAKDKTINLNLFLEYCKRKWPDRKLPPTPPPEPEPEPVPPKKGKKDDKKKGKKK